MKRYCMTPDTGTAGVNGKELAGSQQGAWRGLLYATYR